MKTAVVTGAGGFIGGALTQKLLQYGYRVIGIDKSKEYMHQHECENFMPIAMDLSYERLSDYLAERVDVLYYLSWGGSLGGKDLYDVHLQLSNASVAAEVCEDVSPFTERFIFVSSSYESMKNENHSQYPVNVYGIAKRTASDLCASISVRANMGYNKVILTNTYGVGDRSKKAVNTIITAMLNDMPLKLVKGDRPNDWMYIDDTVRGLVTVYEHGEPFQSYYLGHKEISTFREKILSMGKLFCPDRMFKFGEMPEDTFIDYDEIRKSTNSELEFDGSIDFCESIRKTADWLKYNDELAKNAGGG